MEDKINKLTDIKIKVKNVFDAFDHLELRGKAQALLVTQMASVLEQVIMELNKEIEEV